MKEEGEGGTKGTHDAPVTNSDIHRSVEVLNLASINTAGDEGTLSPLSDPLSGPLYWCDPRRGGGGIAARGDSAAMLVKLIVGGLPFAFRNDSVRLPA